MFGCQQAQKTVEEQRVALSGMAKLQGTAAQTKARLLDAHKRLKSLEWEHEVCLLPASDGCSHSHTGPVCVHRQRSSSSSSSFGRLIKLNTVKCHHKHVMLAVQDRMCWLELSMGMVCPLKVCL